MAAVGLLLLIACGNLAGLLVGAQRGAASRAGHAAGTRRQPRCGSSGSC